MHDVNECPLVLLWHKYAILSFRFHFWGNTRTVLISYGISWGNFSELYSFGALLFKSLPDGSGTSVPLELSGRLSTSFRPKM